MVMTHFLVQQSGIRPSDTVAFLTGKLQDGTPFVGMDTITIVGGGKATVASTSMRMQQRRVRRQASHRFRLNCAIPTATASLAQRLPRQP